MLARRRASGVLQRATRSSLRRAVKPALAALYSTEVTPPQEYNAKRLDKPRRDVFDQAAANPSYGIFIKPWDGIKSIVEAYAVIRGVEKQYGQLREYKFMRDADLTESYQSFLAADFLTHESWLAIPEGGAKIKITIPAHDARQPGGLGLDDLRPLLVPEVKPTTPEIPRWKDESNDSQVSGREMQVVVERARTRIQYIQKAEQKTATRNLKLAVGRNFLAWGGFASPLPLPTQPAEGGPLEGAPTTTSVPHLRPQMASAWGKWHAMIGDNYPIFTPTHRRVTAASTVEGFESDTRAREGRPFKSEIERSLGRDSGAPRPKASHPSSSAPAPEPIPASLVDQERQRQRQLQGVPPTEPSFRQVAERGRRAQLRNHWAHSSYPTSETGAATASSSPSASVQPDKQATPSLPATTAQIDADSATPHQASRKSRKDRLKKQAEGKDADLKQRSTALREEEAAVEKKSLSTRIVDLFGRW